MDFPIYQELHLCLPEEIIFTQIFPRLPPHVVTMLCKALPYKERFLDCYTNFLQDKFHTINLKKLLTNLQPADRENIKTGLILFNQSLDEPRKKSCSKMYSDEIRALLPYLKAEPRFYLSCYAGLMDEVKWMFQHPQAFPTLQDEWNIGLVISKIGSQHNFLRYVDYTPLKAACLGGTVEVIRFFLRADTIPTKEKDLLSVLEFVVAKELSVALNVLLNNLSFASILWHPKATLPFISNPVFRVFVQHPNVDFNKVLNRFCLSKLLKNPFVLKYAITERKVDPNLLKGKHVRMCIEAGIIGDYLDHPFLFRQEASRLICEFLRPSHCIYQVIKFLLDDSTLEPYRWVTDVPLDFWVRHGDCLNLLLVHSQIDFGMINLIFCQLGEAGHWDVVFESEKLEIFDPLYDNGCLVRLAISKGDVSIIRRLLSHPKVSKAWSIPTF